MTDKEDEQNKPKKKNRQQHANKKNRKIIKNNVPMKLEW